MKASYTSDDEIIVGRTGEVVVNETVREIALLDLSPDLRVSHRHARLFYSLSTWWVEDLNSRNGTTHNGKKINEAVMLMPDDELRIGDTVLHVEFETADSDPGPGSVENSLAVDETQPPATVPEQGLLEILVAVTNIVAYSKSQQGMLEGFLREISNAFPSSERRSILLIEGKELIPLMFWPPDQSYLSFNLARQAIKSQQALHWVRKINIEQVGQIAESLLDTLAAMYAPMISNGHTIGVVHIDSTSSESAFNKSDLQLLSVIANTIGSALAVSGSNVIHKIPSIFISYAHVDRNLVDRLASDLRRRRIKVWFDEHLKVGDAWRSNLATAIEATNAFVLLMSPHSVESEYVKWELETALALGKKIFPLRYQGGNAPVVIRSVQYIDIETNYESAIDELAGQLQDLSKE